MNPLTARFGILPSIRVELNRAFLDAKDCRTSAELYKNNPVTSESIQYIPLKSFS